MKFFLLFLFLSLFILNLSAQPSKTLSEQLWDRVESCYSMFEDYNEDGKIDCDQQVDDSKNGYLKVGGAFPTCGCSCYETVGAYKDVANRFTFIEEEQWLLCELKYKIKSNRDLNEVFPENFGARTFIPDLKNYIDSTSRFYLEIDIPRYGTDTKVTIKTIPFGIKMVCADALGFEYYQKESFLNCSPISGLLNVVKSLSNAQSLDYLLNRQYNKLTELEMKSVEQSINGDYGGFTSKEEFVRVLNELKTTYDLYLGIKHETILLGWDKDNARFYIKEKGIPVNEITFREFILEKPFWFVGC